MTDENATRPAEDFNNCEVCENPSDCSAGNTICDLTSEFVSRTVPSRIANKLLQATREERVMNTTHLREKLAAATGPDREIDAQIWLAVTPGATRKALVVPPTELRNGWTIDETREASGRLITVPAYTESLDAAMTLVPDGVKLQFQSFGGPGPIWLVEPNERYISGATPALALCIAALEAREAL